MGETALAPPGLPLCFSPPRNSVSGNLWHGTYPKEDEALRVHCAMMYARNYVFPGESFADIPEDIVAANGPEFARLVGRKAWQGYGDEGPDVMRLAGVQRAHVTPSA